MYYSMKSAPFCSRLGTQSFHSDHQMSNSARATPVHSTFSGPVTTKSNCKDSLLHPVTDYQKVRSLGSGSYSTVYEVEERATCRHYAMKVISKELLKRERKVNQAQAERMALTTLRHHPNVLKICRCFQDPQNLYFVTELALGGDVEHVLNQCVAFDKSTAVPILGQVLLAIAYMHSQNVVHRDLKPGNLLFDEKNRVRIADFGSAQVGKPTVPEFVGSPSYVSPEVLAKKVATEESDLWGFGCLVYALIVGQSPFTAPSSYLCFEKVRNCDYEMPPFVPPDAADLIRRLLVQDPAERLGAGTAGQGYAPIRSHPFFAGITDWETLPEQAIAIVASQDAALWKQSLWEARQSADKESVIRTAKVTYIGPQKELSGDLVLTDSGRVLVKHGDELVVTICITEGTKVYQGEGMLHVENGEQCVRVKMDETLAHEWKRVLHDAVESCE
jgi:3-phosphoinositide dependent protein kinase-1